PSIVGSTSLAIADLDGDGQPEIVGARSGGGLVAFTHKNGVWSVLWQTTSTFGAGLCDWAGPSIHDLDDDGKPEIVFYGNVYDNLGNALDESLGASVTAISVGYIPVVADVDGDGTPDLITGTTIFAWDKVNKKWVA